MRDIITLTKRELLSYFATPLAYVFVVIFLILSSVFTFYVGNLYETHQANLSPFFNFHPWLYLFLIPALSMRLWSEERKSGTIELLLTFPIKLWHTVVAKFFAAWLMCALALVFTIPTWLTVSYLGDPDHGIILTSYIASWFMAGSFLAIGACMSAMTQNQVIAFILTVTVCFLFVVAGSPIVLSVFQGPSMPLWLLDAISGLSTLTHFNTISKGILALNDVAYFVILIISWLFATTWIIDIKKAS